MIRLILAAIIAILGVACMGNREATTSDPLQIGTCLGPTSDPYELGDLSIQDEELLVHVQTGGGCARHSFAICWDGAVLDSYPPQVNLVLSHNAHGDTCDALLLHDLRVDLAPIRAVPGSPVVLHVTGATAQLAGTTNTVTLSD